MNVGFIGMGNIGRPMCERLIEHGHSIAAFDIDRWAVARIVSSGAAAAESYAATAAESDVVFTCLPSPEAVVTAITGKDGLLTGARPGTTIVDLSTNDPDVIQALAERARAVDVGLVDAPVAGGVPKAMSGTLTVLVGGSKEDFERVYPLLECLGSHIFHLGPPGSGCVVKLANNLLAFCNMAAANEAFMAVKRWGIAPARFLEALEVGSGGSAILERFHRKILPGDFDPEFSIDLAYKDINLALKIGEQAGVPMTFAGAVKVLMQQARGRGYGSEDCCALVRVLEDIVGDTVRSERADQVSG
jgi:2-hydroxymethylglutarate dehydrogenase